MWSYHWLVLYTFRAKYPLAVLSKILEELPPSSCSGFDIACSFAPTIDASSLSARFKETCTKLCVNAFHSYAHSYLCQIKNHPLFIPGTGLEDFETMERIFSSSNQLASVTRYASSFRCQLFIETFFRQWDQEKGTNVGTFILRNYIQALDIIKRNSAALEETLRSLNVTHQMLDDWEKEEQLYFNTLGQKNPWDTHAVAYVELLRELRAVDNEWTNINSCFIQSIPDDYTFLAPGQSQQAYAQDASSTAHIETRRRHINERYNRVLNDVQMIKCKMGISHRWELNSAEYQGAL